MADGLEKLIEPSNERTSSQAVYSNSHIQGPRARVNQHAEDKAQSNGETRMTGGRDYRNLNHQRGNNQDNQRTHDREQNRSAEGPRNQRHNYQNQERQGQRSSAPPRATPDNRGFTYDRPHNQRHGTGPPQNQRYGTRQLSNQRYGPSPHQRYGQNQGNLTNQGYRPNGNNDDPTRRRPNNVICYYCQRPGHYAKFCINNPRRLHNSPSALPDHHLIQSGN